jgi:hypothetical protein
VVIATRTDGRGHHAPTAHMELDRLMKEGRWASMACPDLDVQIRYIRPGLTLRGLIRANSTQDFIVLNIYFETPLARRLRRMLSVLSA